LIRLQSLGRVPYDLLADQERQVRRFRSAKLLVEEILATDGGEARWRKSTLTRLFRANPVRARVDAPSFEFRGGAILIVRS